MHVLLDEGVPQGLWRHVTRHEVTTIGEASSAGFKNGKLLQLAARVFDVLLTVDRKLKYQQRFSDPTLAVIVIYPPSNDIIVLRPLMPAVLAALPNAKAGEVTHVLG
jgi:hypothetical protein